MVRPNYRDYNSVEEAVDASGGCYYDDNGPTPFAIRVSEVSAQDGTGAKPIFAVVDLVQMEEVARISHNSVIRIKVRGYGLDGDVAFLFGLVATEMPEGFVEVAIRNERTCAYPGYWVGFKSSCEGKMEPLTTIKEYDSSDESKDAPFLVWCSKNLRMQSIRDKQELPLAELTASVNAHYPDRGLCTKYPLWARGDETWLRIGTQPDIYMPYNGHWGPPGREDSWDDDCDSAAYLVVLSDKVTGMSFDKPSPIELLAFPDSPWRAVEPWVWKSK